jgi:hypothetical protein
LVLDAAKRLFKSDYCWASVLVWPRQSALFWTDCTNRHRPWSALHRAISGCYCRRCSCVFSSVTSTLRSTSYDGLNRSYSPKARFYLMYIQRATCQCLTIMAVTCKSNLPCPLIYL